MMLQIGDQFDRFQIRSHMAQGGMADIYRAYDLMHGKEVVLKIPNRMMIGDPAQYERFQRELEVTNSLSHPAIQKGLGSGQFNRTPFLVTEFIDGKSMRDVVAQETPMPPDEATNLVRKLADGIAYIHQHDVVHRDLKPENILITADNQPIILDFGLALTKNAHRVTYANFTPTAGTPDYMSPEQIEGQRGDERTDIYALGTIFYELLTGHLPFSGDSYQVVATQHLQGNAPRLDREKSNISPQLAAVVARCLQRAPEGRYPNMQALIHDLDHLDTVDISVLEKSVEAAVSLPFWQSSALRAVAISLLVLAGIVIFALIAQGLAPK